LLTWRSMYPASSVTSADSHSSHGLMSPGSHERMSFADAKAGTEVASNRAVTQRRLVLTGIPRPLWGSGARCASPTCGLAEHDLPRRWSAESLETWTLQGRTRGGGPGPSGDQLLRRPLARDPGRVPP